MHKINTRHEMFTSIESCLEILLECEVLNARKTCIKCGGSAPVVVYTESKIKRLIYRCKKRNCQFKTSIYNTKLPLQEFCLIVFKLMIGGKYNEVTTEVSVSEKTLVNIRKVLRKIYKIYIDKRKVVLGGMGFTVQCDESVICRRGIVKCPSAIEDNVKDTVWILGCIDNTPSKNFFVKQVKDRSVDTLSRTLEGNICVGSYFHTDGYSSYPKVAENLALNHKIVNHSLGFKAPDGTHTNGIEGFWAILKDKLRREHGVNRDNISDWLDEYTFYRRYIQSKEPEEVSFVFFEILKILFDN